MHIRSFKGNLPISHVERFIKTSVFALTSFTNYVAICIAYGAVGVQMTHAAFRYEFACPIYCLLGEGAWDVSKFSDEECSQFGPTVETPVKICLRDLYEKRQQLSSKKSTSRLDSLSTDASSTKQLVDKNSLERVIEEFRERYKE